MGTYKDVTDENAVAKLKELAMDVKICMFCTDLASQPFSTRPMAVQDVDDQGNLWFISSRKSNKNFEIKHDDKVQLIFAKMTDEHYLSVFGSATIFTDRNKLEEIWSPIAKAWFEEGKDDPDVTLIKVQPEDVYYWDTKAGKVITLLKIAASALTGIKSDGGVEGRIIV